MAFKQKEMGKEMTRDPVSKFQVKVLELAYAVYGTPPVRL